MLAALLLNDVLHHKYDEYETVISIINKSMSTFMFMPRYLFFVSLLWKISTTSTYKVLVITNLNISVYTIK